MKILKKYEKPVGPYKGKQSRIELLDQKEELFSVSDLINNKKEIMEK